MDNNIARLVARYKYERPDTVRKEAYSERTYFIAGADDEEKEFLGREEVGKTTWKPKLLKRLRDAGIVIEVSERAGERDITTTNKAFDDARGNFHNEHGRVMGEMENEKGDRILAREIYISSWGSADVTTTTDGFATMAEATKVHEEGKALVQVFLKSLGVKITSQECNLEMRENICSRLSEAALAEAEKKLVVNQIIG